MGEAFKKRNIKNNLKMAKVDISINAQGVKEK